jgi:catechol 2,3-dioxygenase-like lactoylglutathione lyase family enzyme
MGRAVTSGAAFVYDARGPRTSPAIEVQNWANPLPVGAPRSDPTAVGLHALGFSVPDLTDTVCRLQSLGCTVLGSATSPFGLHWATLADPTGVRIDVVDDATMSPGTSRLRHVRATVTDLSTSVSWYQRLGFEVVGRNALDDGSFLGLEGQIQAEAVWLRLPDEPFEVLLIGWRSPRSHGCHYAQPNHAGLYRVAVCVDDARASYWAMSRTGWRFDRPPVAVKLDGTSVPTMWICFLCDPDGIPFELVERPRSAFHLSRASSPPEQGPATPRGPSPPCPRGCGPARTRCPHPRHDGP